MPTPATTTDYSAAIVEALKALDDAKADVETAWGEIGHYSGAAGAYVEVASVTVTAGLVGELKEILIISDDYAHTLIQITIDGTVWCTDWSPSSSMPIIFEDLRLAALAVVKVEAKSSDVLVTITVDAVIVGKQIG